MYISVTQNEVQDSILILFSNNLVEEPYNVSSYFEANVLDFDGCKWNVQEYDHMTDNSAVFYVYFAMSA